MKRLSLEEADGRELKPGGEGKETARVVVPHILGRAILLMDAATQTEGSEGKVSSRLIRSKSLPPMFNLE
ncbi:hypothetical protein Tco_1485248 [Tanacetum coccineum]